MIILFIIYCYQFEVLNYFLCEAWKEQLILFTEAVYLDFNQGQMAFVFKGFVECEH